MPIVKIPISSLQPGMYVVDAGIPWTQAPLLYAEAGYIASHEDVQRIARQGFTEVYHDTERYRPLGLPITEGLTVPDIAWGRRVPLEQELARAREVYTASIEHVKNFMHSTPSTPVNMEAARPLVESILTSLDRNLDALIFLAKLRHSDAYTFRHCVNVSIFSVAYARFRGLDREHLYSVGLAGLFHDYGKALVPSHILNAPRPLKPWETEIMHSHVLRGYEKLKTDKAIAPEILLGVLQHHEKFNGTGYPYGLAGDAISLYGRILSLSDVYDALTSWRVYKQPLAPHKVLGIMYQMRGQAWMPTDVDLFVKFMGVYPVGSPVELSNGLRGVVCRSNQRAPAKPWVKLALDKTGRPLHPTEVVDLTHADGLEIARPLSSQESASLDVPGLLGLPQRCGNA